MINDEKLELLSDRTNTKYKDLPEKEKLSDIKIVKKIINLLDNEII